MATGRGQFLLSLRQGLERIRPGRYEGQSGESGQKEPTREGGNNNRRRRRRRCEDETHTSPSPPVQSCPTPGQSHYIPGQSRSYPVRSWAHPTQLRSYPTQSRSYPTCNSFERLPPEIIVKIFSYLDAASLISVGLVNRQWNELANDGAMWYELYAREMRRRQQRPRQCEATDSVSPVSLAAAWKKLLFREMGWHRDTVWKTDLRHVNLNTGMPEQTEQVLRNLNVMWEITVSLKGGKQIMYKQSHSVFSDSSVTVCWSRGTWPKIHTVYSVQLCGVLGSPRLLSYKPPWRSLISKTVLSRSERWRCIGTDSLVKLMQFDEGITVGVWRGTWVIAFIMATLHFHRLVERSVLGFPLCPYREEQLSPVSREVPRGFGDNGYTVHVLLHNSTRRIMRCRFSPVSCTRAEHYGEYMQLRVLNAAMSEQHAPVLGKISFPWSAGELHGDVKNCCVMTVSVLDADQRSAWCVSSLSSVTLDRYRALNETYDGEQYALRYRDSDGKLRMTLVWMKDLQLYFLISLHIWIRRRK